MSKNRSRGVREYCTGLWWPARRVSEHTRLPLVIECGSGGGGGVLPCNPSGSLDYSLTETSRTWYTQLHQLHQWTSEIECIDIETWSRGVYVDVRVAYTYINKCIWCNGSGPWFALLTQRHGGQ